jgi:hypothetical protein
MVISISEPGTDGGGGGLVEFAELELFASAAAASSFFFFLLNKLPSPFTIASEGLVATLLELLELVEDWLSAVGWPEADC